MALLVRRGEEMWKRVERKGDRRMNAMKEGMQKQIVMLQSSMADQLSSMARSPFAG